MNGQTFMKKTPTTGIRSFNMKAAYAISVTMLVLFSAVPGLVSAQGIPTFVDLVLNTQTPYPVEPGEILNLEVALQNEGSSSDALTLMIVPTDPFTLLPGEEATKAFSSVPSFGSVTHSYQMKVSDDAISATYDMEFRYYPTGQSGSFVQKTIQILVQGTPKIIIEEITTVPEVIEPGHEVEFIIKIKNVGSGEATQIELDLEAEADSETEESLIVPVLSGGSFYIDSLMPDEEKIAVFKLDVDNDAEYKSYPASLEINYQDEGGNDVTATRTVGIPVRGSPIIKILSAKVDGGDFKVDIENIGTGDAKALKIEFIQDGEVKDSSVASELKPTRHKTLRFSGFRYGEATIKISYLDVSNEVFEEDNTVTVKQATTTQEGSSNDFSIASAVLFILVLAEGYYIWRLRKKLKRK